jgi:hypothetical protein
MNNENKTRIRTVWAMISVMILTLIFGVEPSAHAQMQEAIVYNKYILYINKYNNIVNIKDIINIDYNNISKRKSFKKIRILYLINDLHSRNTFVMPAYSVKLNLNARVDKRVIISRLANAIKSQETGGASAYYRHSYSSSACGAYQYMPQTWNNYMGYKSACQAPTWVQDSRMVHELEFNFDKYHDWRKVIAAHLLPSRAGNMKTWSKPVRGNPTVQEYVNSVFNKANIALA